MAEQSELPSSRPNDSTFAFQQDAPARIPRGWERAPKSPYGGRHGGRKVWKRFDTVAKDHGEKYGEDAPGSLEATAVLGDTTNTSKSVKRMRVKGGVESMVESTAEGKENKPSKYLATLRDKAQGTPRRKQALRKSLKSDHARLQTQDTDNGIPAGSAVSKDVVREEVGAVQAEIQEDTLLASQSPVLQIEAIQDVNTEESVLSEDVVQQEEQDIVHEEVREDTLRASQSPVLQVEAIQHIITAESVVTEDVVQEEEQDTVHEEIQEDTLHVSQSPAQEDVRRLLGSASNGKNAPHDGPSRQDDDETEPAMGETLQRAKSTDLQEAFTPSSPPILLDSEEGSHFLKGTISEDEDIPKYLLPDPVSPLAPKHSALTTPLQRPDIQTSQAEAVVENNHIAPVPQLEASTGSRGNINIHNHNHLSASKLEARTVSNEHADSSAETVPSTLNVATPMSASAAKSRRPKQLLDALSPGGSPQIGTSLLRRESLRSKETPSKKRELRKTRSPKKRNTLSRRDTLQEREILQKVIAETSHDPTPEDAELPIVRTLTPSSEELAAKHEQIEHDEEHTNSGTGANEEQPTANAATGAESPLSTSDDTKVKKDLHRAMEAIEVFQHPTRGDATDISTPSSDAEAGEMNAIDKANELIAEAELEEAKQAMQTAQEQSEQQSRTTRSGARFSDDTSMLRDFLHRAQASKAAKTPILSPLDAPEPATSPRRSPRKALGPRKGNAPTPPKSGDIANRPGTPPGMPKADIADSDDGEETSATPSSCRRSTRTRLPAASKAPPSAPSFIPVRRADGTDPVVLQKSQAQELAMVTRANTRRNKGQSKPPLLALKDLPADAAELAIAKHRADDAKSVGWAETLASYQGPNGKADEVEETKPKVRRMRGLGAVNGTPAAKKTTAGGNGTPARRGKVR